MKLTGLTEMIEAAESITNQVLGDVLDNRENPDHYEANQEELAWIAASAARSLKIALWNYRKSFGPILTDGEM